MTTRCRICGNDIDNPPVVAREMMFGTREEFVYLECAACGCLQIMEMPAGIGQYYSPGYYSLSSRPRPSRLKHLLGRARSAQARGQAGLPGRLLVRVFGIAPVVEWLAPAGLDFDGAILEVGSGAGHLLRYLYHAGFSNLTGIDPYIDQDHHYLDNFRVLKRSLDEVESTFDCVIMNHSLEHMPDPLAALRQVSALLKPGCYALVRTPVAGSEAWKRYRANWVQLDAPRHLVIQSEASMKILAAGAGLDLARVVYDSEAFQFWGSEQYARDIPLHDPRSHFKKPAEKLFSAREIQAWEVEARMLNASRRGDQARFYLRKPLATAHRLDTDTA
jgi:2-polyprenyl-3-methyl-5-hydroxy-6-metoxy-1,4-benzoquinol methylase